MITYQDAPPKAQARPWRMPRAEMADRAAIRTRMAADMDRLAEETGEGDAASGALGGVEPWHLVTLGWTRAQVDAHAAAAAELAGIRQAGKTIVRVATPMEA